MSIECFQIRTLMYMRSSYQESARRFLKIDVKKGDLFFYKFGRTLIL